MKRYIFIKCPRLIRFDHGLEFRQDRSCLLDRAHTQRVKSSPWRSWFITERITVFTDFSFEKLRSADVTVTVRRVTIGFLIDRDTSGGV